jgi:indole-3-glycerol phosphate synthase
MLDQIVAYKRSLIEGIDTTSEIRKMEGQIGHLPHSRDFKQSLLADPDISIIAEIKRWSPSKGILNNHIELPHLVQSYQRAGAKAISVLTEDKYFGGCLDDLIETYNNTSLPVLRKDFIVHDYQIWESRLAGADAILLIVRVLSYAELSRFHQLAHALGLDILIEVHNRDELNIALSLSPEIIGINNRDLATFKTDLTNFETLAREISASTLIIAESGVHNRNDILYLKERGADAVLIGESIITSPDPYMRICELRGVAI